MQKQSISAKRKAYITVMRVLMGISVSVTCALVLFLIGYVLWKGLPNVSWELLTTKPSYLSNRIGILPDILNTVYIVLATLVLVLPLGVGAAIYLTEYAKNKKLVDMIEYTPDRQDTARYDTFNTAGKYNGINHTPFSSPKSESTFTVTLRHRFQALLSGTHDRGQIHDYQCKCPC